MVTRRNGVVFIPLVVWIAGGVAAVGATVWGIATVKKHYDAKEAMEAAELAAALRRASAGVVLAGVGTGLGILAIKVGGRSLR